jgi:hypothetical protein
MLADRSTNFIIALQNRLSYASQGRINALLPRAKPHEAGAPAFEQNEIPLKKHINSSTSSHSPGTSEKAQSEPGRTAGSTCPRGPELAKMRNAIDRIWR